MTHPKRRRPHPLELREVYGVRVHASAFSRLVSTIANFDSLGFEAAARLAARGIETGEYKLQSHGDGGNATYIMGRAA